MKSQKHKYTRHLGDLPNKRPEETKIPVIISYNTDNSNNNNNNKKHIKKHQHEINNAEMNNGKKAHNGPDGGLDKTKRVKSLQKL
ncbi:hypothetical protein FF38_00140 [Lucilia cuprina]|uniref:Uncharacterized protein n=1 Tax=Lucilia cuprina TaxID=7375 RepID=A0A0L0C141_LUCCU|nr:hypothetical protein FF38_00140 [Lucilia cuprina]